MYGLPTYTMNGNLDETRKKLLDSYFYGTLGNEELLKTMLTHKADPNIQDIHGNTPLHLAMRRKNLDYGAILLAAGANPNIENYKGDTPLHIAAGSGLVKSIQLLLNSKGNPNLVNFYRQTPLHSALHNGLTPQTATIAFIC